MSNEVKTNSTVLLVARFLSFIHPLLWAWSRCVLIAVDTIRLYIVEKNSKVRQALEARLSSSSRIEVVGTARGAAEGVRRYPDLEPDVILLDAKTAGRPNDVADVVSELAQQGSSIIVLTSYAFETEREAALDSGAAQYLLKDIDSAALIREIESLGKSSGQQAKD
jgi:DNA-binding NarL/FixJ family response regulator